MAVMVFAKIVLLLCTQHCRSQVKFDNAAGQEWIPSPAAGCSETYTTAYGEIHHPAISERYYKSNALCAWIIKSSTPLYFYFSEFITETNHDNVFARNGGSIGSPLIGKFSGKSVNGTFTTKGDAYIQFQSDSNVVGAGFVLHWKPYSAEEQCKEAHGFCVESGDRCSHTIKIIHNSCSDRCVCCLYGSQPFHAGINDIFPSSLNVGKTSMDRYDHRTELVVYRAGVVDFAPTTDWTLSPMERMLTNVRLMINFTNQAKDKGVDILVFPENGIVSIHPANRTHADSFGQYVPEPKDQSIPCDAPTHYTTQVMQALSCMVRDAGIYVVVNLCEHVQCKKPYEKECDANGNKNYNTNVAFDRNGMVVAKYRKLHLWHEQYWYNYGAQPAEEAMFTTDFGVTFTQHICFDQVFESPSLENIMNYGVKDVIMTIAWVEHYPFGLAPAWQYGFSRGAGVNVLASGLRLFYKGSFGSGIYTSASDPKNSIFVYNDFKEEGVLLVADVTTKRSSLVPPRFSSELLEQELIQQINLNNKVSPNVTLPMNNHKITRMDLSPYTTTVLKPRTMTKTTACQIAEDQTQVCCEIEWYNKYGTTHYLLMAFSGVSYDSGYGLYSQVCAVLHCPTGHLDSCGDLDPSTRDNLVSFNLTGNFKTPHVNPSVVSQDQQLVSEHHWSYEISAASYDLPTHASITSPALKNLQSALLVGRRYDKDPYCQQYPC